MNQDSSGGIVEIIGRENFQWLSGEFRPETKLKDVPYDILNRVSMVDVAIRDYGRDPNAITTIALITFAYRMGGKPQNPKYGTNDMLLLKVLAKNEISRRAGERLPQHDQWDLPLYELLTGEVGERIREMKLMTNPL